jgi:hypothetical protein
VFLNLGTSGSLASTAAREYVLRYCSQRHLEANLFRRLEQRLCETGTRECRPPTGCTDTANEDAIIAAVEYLKLYRTRHVTIIYGCYFANSHISTLRLRSDPHNILWTDEAYFMREGLFHVHSRQQTHTSAIREWGY